MCIYPQAAAIARGQCSHVLSSYVLPVASPAAASISEHCVLFKTSRTAHLLSLFDKGLVESLLFLLLLLDNLPLTSS